MNERKKVQKGVVEDEGEKAKSDATCTTAVLGQSKIDKTPSENKSSHETVLAAYKGGEGMRIEAFPKTERPPALPYEALKYSNQMRILDARKVSTRFGDRKLIEVEILQTNCPLIRPGIYTLWCSRSGLQRIFEKLGEIYDDPRGLVVEIRETGRAGRAYNYVLEVKEEKI